MSLFPAGNRARPLAIVAAIGALVLSGCGVAAESTAATVNGKTITDTQVEQAARVQAIGNVALGEDDEVPLEVRRRALSFLVAAQLLKDEQARLNLDEPDGLADQVASQLQADQAFAKLSEGEQNDLVSAAVVLSTPPPGPDGTQAAGLPLQIQQTLTSDPAARRRFRQAHPQMFRELCADVAEAQPDQIDEVRRAMAADPDAAFEKFGALDQCQTAAASNGLVPVSSPQWSTVNAVVSGAIGEVDGPITATVSNPDPSGVSGGETVEQTRWVRPQGSRSLTDAGAAEFVSSLDANSLLYLLALQTDDVQIDPRYGDMLTVGPPDGLQIVRVQPNGSGAATPAAPATGDPTA